MEFEASSKMRTLDACESTVNEVLKFGYMMQASVRKLQVVPERKSSGGVGWRIK